MLRPRRHSHAAEMTPHSRLTSKLSMAAARIASGTSSSGLVSTWNSRRPVARGVTTDRMPL